MTEEEVGRQAEGEREQAAPPVPPIASGDSAVAGSAELSFDADALAESVIEKLSPKIDNMVDARFKSGKDKRFAKVDEIASWVEAAGGDFNKIRGALTETELLGRIEALEAGSRGAGGAAPAMDTVEAKTAEILDEAGISYDDPVVTELSKKSYKTSDDWYHAINREVAKRVKQANISSAAAVAAPGKSVMVESGEDYESLAGKLGKLRGKFDPESQKLRKEIQSKMESLEPEMTFVDETSFTRGL